MLGVGCLVLGVLRKNRPLGWSKTVAGYVRGEGDWVYREEGEAAPQGFRPGLRTIAPVRGLKTRLPEAALAAKNAALFLER